MPSQPPSKARGVLLIKNQKGLHTRPATEFVKCASTFESKIFLSYKEYHVNGKSLLGLLMLAASKGAKILVEAIGQDADDAVKALQAMAKEVKNKSEIRQVAIISSESVELGNTIADTIDKVGKDGVVTVEESQSLGIESEVVEGMEFDRGYVSAYMITNSERMEAELKDVPILVTDMKISTAQVIVPLLEKLLQTGKKDFVIIDMRNDYEHKSGHFRNSILPNLSNFRDLPKVVDGELKVYKDKTVVTVCTGGVRCEKASAYLLKKGFKDVYQLENGIVTYMEKYPGEDFDGALYVFDQRVTMDFLPPEKRTIIGRCYLCNNKSELYVNCKNNACHYHFICCEECNTGNGACCSQECRVIQDVTTNKV